MSCPNGYRIFKTCVQHTRHQRKALPRSSLPSARKSKTLLGCRNKSALREAGMLALPCSAEQTTADPCCHARRGVPHFGSWVEPGGSKPRLPPMHEGRLTIPSCLGPRQPSQPLSSLSSRTPSPGGWVRPGGRTCRSR